MKMDERGYNFVRVLGLTILTLLMLVGIAGATSSPNKVLSLDGSKTYTTYDLITGEGCVYVTDTITGKLLTTIDIYRYDGPYGLALSPDGKELYVLGCDGGQ